MCICSKQVREALTVEQGHVGLYRQYRDLISDRCNVFKRLLLFCYDPGSGILNKLQPAHNLLGKPVRSPVFSNILSILDNYK